MYPYRLYLSPDRRPAPLVVLGGGHNADRIAIDKGKNRNLASCHELLDDHLITGRTKLLVLHDLLDA